MNVYKVTTPTISTYVLAEDAYVAMDCFIDVLGKEGININESDINCTEQIAREYQSNHLKSDSPSRLLINIYDVRRWLASNGYKVTREDDKAIERL